MTNNAGGPSKPNLDIAVRMRIDEICDQYEDQWRNAVSPPDLKVFFQDCKSIQSAEESRSLLVELILLDIEYRDNAGQVADSDHYRLLFPEAIALIEQIFSGQSKSFRGQNHPKSRLGTIAADEATLDASTPGEKQLAPVNERIRYFGDYELIHEIARGGMGVVYRARQISLNREIALKMILAGQIAGSDQIRRFQIEAEAAANLDHCGIVPIYDIGQHNGHHYFSMKLIEGETLTEYSHRLCGDQNRIIELIIAIADAIHHAHQRGILHRDLKPGNILIGADGQPWVTDFGLARNLQSDQQVTHTGAVVGTPGFMSPEQATGSAVTTATDIYSIGAIFYHLLCGRPPHQGNSVLETLKSVTDDEPQAPRKLKPDISSDLELICMKCLDKNPTKRYASAGELAEELKAYRVGDPLHVRPPTAGELARKWLAKRVGNAGWIPVIALSIGLMSGLAIWIGTVGEALAHFIPTYQSFNSEAVPILAIQWPLWLSRTLIIGFLFVCSTIGWWTARLVQTRTPFADLGAGISVGLLSGLIAAIAGVGAPFIYLSTSSIAGDLDLLQAIAMGGYTDQGLPPIDQRYPKLEGLSSAQKATLLVNKIKGDRIIGTLVGPLFATLICLSTFGIAGTFQTFVAGPLIRERSRFSAVVNYAAFAMALVATLFIFGTELSLRILFGHGYWFDPTGPLIMGLFASLAIFSIIRRWHWTVSVCFSLLWMISFATIIFNPHIQGPVPETPLKRKAVSDAQRLVDLNPSRREYQIALARAEFDFAQLLSGRGMPRHAKPHFETAINIIRNGEEQGITLPNERALHSAALFWGALAAIQGGDAKTAARWSTEHLSRYESSTNAAELYVRAVIASGHPVESFLAQGDARSSDVWWRIAQQIRSLTEQEKSSSVDWQQTLSQRVERALDTTNNQQDTAAWPERRDTLRLWLNSQQSWQLFGPYETLGTNAEAFQSENGPEKELIAGDPAVMPKKNINTLPGLPLWLQNELTSQEDVAAFASSTFNLSHDGSVRFRFGSDDASKIWVDGKLIYARNVGRVLFPASDFIDVPNLKAGDHRILIKVYNWQADWGFAIDGGTSDGWPLPLWSSEKSQ